MFPFELQLVQSSSNNNKTVRNSFCMDMQQRSEDGAFFDRLIFGDESTFQISTNVNIHNMLTWGTENPRDMVEHVQD
jgi:hypothetical protein